MKAMTLDYSTLNWVKAEIDESLKQAREALEAFAGNPADLAQMRFCANHLHQVRGTLQMIELYGASLLAEEVEQLAFALLNEEAKRDNNTYEVLMRGILQLPGYLERVQTGHADNPIILLPVLNDLRAARGQNLLSESALFNPDLSVLRPRAVGFEANLNESLVTEADIRSVARKLRPVYQQAFVNWHRNTRDVKHVKQLLQTVNRLEDVSHTDALGQLWWVAGGVLEALIEEGLQANVSIELLMGKVDRQIKRLIEVGELEWAAEPAKELIKNLLYYVAQARPQGARVVTLKQAFRLDEILPSQESIAQATETLAGPSLELMATVSAVIKEDLARVKDGLDIFVRSEQASPLDLEPLLGILRRTADTLGMLGLGVQRRTVLDQSAIIQTITQGQTLPSEGELMNVASALLEVESSLDRLGREKQEQQAQEPASEHLLSEDSFPDGKAQPRLSETEYRQLLAAVIKEAKADMSRIKDAIMNFIVQPMAHSLLTSVPQLMTQIMGCLSLLGQNRAATLLESCKKHIVDKLIERKSIPDQAQLDTLADIISSIEYYLEALDENRSERESFLDFAEDRLAHFTLDAPTVEGETENVLPESMWQPAHQDTTSSLEYSFGEPAQATASLSPANIIRVDDVDQEIIDIFLEEAQEELSSIATHLPEWRHDPENRHVLTTVRRSFHTLKGSGRMVGAAAIGEFAWAFEKMLNKVIDGTLEVSPAVFGLVEEAHRALPQLIKSFKENIAPATVVEELMERARRLTEAGDTSALKFPGVLPLPVPDVENIFPDSYSEPASDESMELMLREDVPVMGETDMNTALEIAAAPLPLETEYTEIVLPREVEHVPQPRLDPVLLGIFDREIKGHLEAIEKFIETCVLNSQHCRMTEAMTRTLHTVHGSAAMAGVSEITRPSALLEKYAKRLSLQQTIVGPETIAVLRDSTAFIRETLAALHDADMPMLDASELMGTISSLDKAVPDESDPHSLEKKDFSEQDNNLAVPDTDNEIVEIFLEEAREILDASEIVLQQWVTDQSNNKLLEELQRELHTLKGGARMAGIAAIGDLSHSLESMVTAVIDGDLVLSPHLPKLMHQTQDRLVEMLESISTNVPVASAHDLIALIEKMISVGPQEEQQQDNVVALVQPPTKPRKENLMLPDDQVSFEEPVPIPIADLPEPIQEDADDRRQVLRPQSEQVRVRAELLDSLVNYAAEISISRSRIEQQVGAFKFNLEEMDEIVDRLRGQLRKLDIETEAQILFRYAETASRENEEFDPLEFDRFSLMQQLSRSLLESVNDLESVEALLKNLTRESETLLLQQSRVNADLHEGLMRTRMVQFAVLMPRLRRIVRQTSQELNKQVEFRVQGAEGEMDRTVLDRVMPSLEHMLRNAIDHGVESADTRRITNKPEAGTITLRLAREGSQVVIEISDDGAGLDMQAIRAKAIERGLLSSNADVTDKDIAQFILEPGFTTVQEITQISGRGVGMDVVTSEVKQLGGTLHISSEKGSGTTFTIRLPLTVSINRALLVQVGDEIYAVPLASIGRIVQIGHEELEQIYVSDNPSYFLDQQSYAFLHLGTVLGGGRTPMHGVKGKLPVLLTQAGDHSIALQADAILGSREIVVKSVGPQLSTVRGITGATILGDGRVVLILDINALVRSGVSALTAPKDSSAPIMSESAPGVITAMVVDDSITVRKVTARLLQRHNIQVLTAKDGVDAVALLQEHIPDVMLLDIEMPRMDGYELATYMRNESRLKGIPIIMITSRTGQKHRDRALQIGVEKYMGKPYQEKDLLKNIEALVSKHLKVIH